MFICFYFFVQFASSKQFYKEIFHLKPVVDPNVPTSLVAQNILLSGKDISISSLNISFHYTNFSRTFFVEQNQGPKLIETKYNNKESFPYANFHSKIWSNNQYSEGTEQNYSFKLVSHFLLEPNDDIIIFDISYISFDNFHHNIAAIINYMLDPKTISTLIVVGYLLYSKVFTYTFDNSETVFVIICYIIIILLYALSLFDRIKNTIMCCHLIFFFLIQKYVKSIILIYSFIQLFAVYTNDVLCFTLISILILLQKSYILMLMIIYYLSIYNKSLLPLVPFIMSLEMLGDIQKSLNKSIYWADDDMLLSSNIIQKLYQNIKEAICSERFWAIAPLLFFAALSKNINYNFTPIHVSIEKYYPQNNTQFFSKNLVPEMIQAIQMDMPLDNCEHCNFKPIYNSSNSTPRDLIIIQGGTNPEKPQLAIKSLRTTGCKARIFLVITQEDAISPNVQKFYNDCGVNVFKYNVNGDVASKFFAGMRFALFEEFLYVGKKYVDRLFYFDCFDTVFQSDPFTSGWEKDVLYVSDEKIPLGQNPYMEMWFRALPNFEFSTFAKYSTICTGIFGGYPDVILKLGQLIHTFYVGQNLIAYDQIEYNYLIHHRILEYAGINCTVQPLWQSIALSVDQYTTAPIGKIYKKDNGFLPAVVHQYNRNPNNYPVYQETCNMS